MIVTRGVFFCFFPRFGGFFPRKWTRSEDQPHGEATWPQAPTWSSQMFPMALRQSPRRFGWFLELQPWKLGKNPWIQCVFYLRKKNSILLGVYNQQLQGTIFLMVFHLQVMDWFDWRKKIYGAILFVYGLWDDHNSETRARWNPMKWWWNIWGNAWTKTHMETVWKPYSVDDLQSTSSFPEG